MEGIRETILLTEVSDLGKPGVLDAVVKNMYPMLEEDVARAQECYHVEESILVLVKQGWGREGAREEVQGWGRGAGVEALESLECQPSVD